MHSRTISSNFRSTAPEYRRSLISQMSSGNSSSHRYHRQRQQHRLSSRSPSHQPTSGFESPLVHPALSRNPATAARGTSNIVDPNSAVDSLAGEFVNPAQAPRGSVRGARSFSSPSSSIGLTAGPASSPLPSVLYPGAASQSRGRLSAGDPRSPGYSSSSRPVAIGSEAYSTGNMTHETHSYGWQGRPSHPHLNPSFMGFDHSLSPSQSLPPDGLYTQQGSTRNYYQSGDLSAHYLSVLGGGLSQGSHHPRSASMSYEFPSSPVPANIPTMPDQSLMPPSPSYFLNQSDYYFAEGSSLSRHPSPIPPVRASSSSSRATPQPQPSLAPSMYYSSPDSTPASASTTAAEQERQVRVLGFRQKPQCWEHGCNGREFSTFSNLLRHQREKSGVVAKAECPVCGAAFTRTTARNIHVAQGKCKRESPG